MDGRRANGDSCGLGSLGYRFGGRAWDQHTFIVRVEDLAREIGARLHRRVQLFLGDPPLTSVFDVRRCCSFSQSDAAVR